MKRQGLWLGVALLLVGCSAPTWQVSDRDLFRRDNYECVRDSRSYGGGSGLIGALALLAAQQQAQSVYEECMESKGYRREVRQ